MPAGAHKYIKFRTTHVLFAEILGSIKNFARLFRTIFSLLLQEKTLFSPRYCYFLPEHRDEYSLKKTQNKYFQYSYHKIAKKNKSLLPLKILLQKKYYGKNHLLLLKHLYIGHSWKRVKVLFKYLFKCCTVPKYFFIWDELLPYLIIRDKNIPSIPRQVVFSIDGFNQNLNLIFMALKELGSRVIAFHPSCSPLHLKIKNTRNEFLGSQAYGFPEMWDFSKSTSEEWYKFMPFSRLFQQKQKSLFNNPIYTFNRSLCFNCNDNDILVFGETPIAPLFTQTSNFNGDLYYFSNFILSFYQDIFEIAFKSKFRVVIKRKRPDFKYDLKNKLNVSYDKRFFDMCANYGKKNVLLEQLHHRVSPYDLQTNFRKSISFVYSTPGRVAALNGSNSLIFYQPWDVCEPILPEEASRWVTGKNLLQKWLRK